MQAVIDALEIIEHSESQYAREVVGEILAQWSGDMLIDMLLREVARASLASA